jgi:hypothetical protein
MLLVLLVIQLAVWQHAVHIAQAAAGQALAAARVQGGTAAGGRAAAAQVLGPAGGGGLLLDAAVRVQRGAVMVTVQVTAAAEAVVPGLRLPVRARAVGPAEPAAGR